MSPLYEILIHLVAWLSLIFGLISIILPTFLGIKTGELAGSIEDVESGKLWFYRHGLSYLIGVAFFLAFLYAMKVLGS